MPETKPADGLDAIDRRLIVATQGGLPRVSRPYDVVADQLGIEVGEVLRRLQRMLDDGVIRRIGAVPNHYALGYTAPTAIGARADCRTGPTTCSRWCTAGIVPTSRGACRRLPPCWAMLAARMMCSTVQPS